jgi:hypothetical protein
MPRAGPVLLHVGYHKTATSWLQKQLFKPPHGYEQLAQHPEIFAGLVRPHGLRFDPAPFRDLVARRRAEIGPGLVPVISSEILSGNPFHGGRESEAYAMRLQETVPEARILISIRSQMRILPSVYMQYLLRGGTMLPEAFFSGTDVPGYFGFDPDHFRYDGLVALYQCLYGRENVFVLTQESLQRDMEAAARALAEFAGNEAFDGLMPAALRVQSASYPEYATPILRRINRIRRGILNPTPFLHLGTLSDLLYRGTGRVFAAGSVARRLQRWQPVSDHVRQRFGDYYSESNRRLAAICAHPLDLSGYP